MNIHDMIQSGARLKIEMTGERYDGFFKQTSFKEALFPDLSKKEIR